MEVSYSPGRFRVGVPLCHVVTVRRLVRVELSRSGPFQTSHLVTLPKTTSNLYWSPTGVPLPT